MCNLVMVISPHQVCSEWLLPPPLSVGGASCYSISCPSAIPSIWWGIQLWGLDKRVTQSLHLPYMVERGLLFQVEFPSSDMVNFESVMGIKPGDCGVVIGYQVDEFTHTWSGEQYVAHSHIYPGFTGKLTSLTHFPLEPGCEDYSFLDRLWLTLNKAWIPSSPIPLRHQNRILP